MRKILFRCKRKDNGEWIYWDMLGRITTHTGKISRATIKSKYGEHYYYYAHQLLDKLDRSTIGQYTGMRDIAGKRIFEGDILEGRDYDEEDGYGVVTWDDGAFVVSNDQLCGTFHDNYNGFEFEVIGNIHDTMN